MKSKKFNLRNITLTLHILFTIMWLGGAASILVPLFGTFTVTKNELLNLLHQMILHIQLFVMLPGAIGLVTTGFILSLRSQWGLKKYYWIIFKLCSTAALVVIEAILNQRFIRDAIRLTAENTPAAVMNSSYIFDRNMTFLLLGIEIVLLAAIVAVSVIKPWGKR